MATPRNRDELVDYIMRDLGAPVIEINIDEVQVDDAIDDALSFMTDYHIDFSCRRFIAHKMTQDEVDQGRVPVSDACLSILGLYPTYGNGSNPNDELFNLEYQFRSNELWNMSGFQLHGYIIAEQYLSLMNDMLNPRQQIRYRRYDGFLYLDISKFRLTADSYIMYEAWMAMTPELQPNIYKDRVFRQLASAYARKRWGQNLIKFGGVQLTGGATLNGQTIIDIADKQIEKLETDFVRNFSEPLGIWVS